MRNNQIRARSARRNATSLRHIFGSISAVEIVQAVATLMFIAWASDSLFYLLGCMFVSGEQCNAAGYWLNAIALLPLPVVVAYAIRLTRRFEATAPVEFIETVPRPVPALVIFLSQLRDTDREANIALASQDFSDREVRDKILGPWRMVVEAFDNHKDRLERVVLIPSFSSRDPAKPGKVDPGSIEQVNIFKDFFNQIFPESNYNIQAIGELDREFANGVNFTDPTDLINAANAAITHLAKQYKKPNDIVIDVTGGTKQATAAGTAAALDSGRRFQYVCTQTYKVQIYDPVYVSQTD